MTVVYQNEKKAKALAKKLGVELAKLEELDGGERVILIQWVVIGAASNGRTLYPPETEWVQNVVDLMDRTGTPVFFGNLRSVAWARDHWRAEFPKGGNHAN